MKSKLVFTITGFLFISLAHGATAELLQGYRNAGAGPFSPEAGKSAWIRQHPAPGGGEARSCASCHGADPRAPGRHVETGKPIEPMGLSVNSTRLGDPAKVEKWFRRNCRWTLGRECTPQEKGDFIQYLTSN